METKEMIETLRYKANNIKAHIEPEFFNEVANKLEKQVAKKVEEHNKTCKCRVFDYMDYECTQRVPYCCVCGQKIDWSEADE